MTPPRNLALVNAAPRTKTSTPKPKMPAPKRSRAPRLSPAARKAQLLECAIGVFAREGINHANHTQIAAEAGVSLASVFGYFPTHEDLAHAVLDHVSSFMLNRLIIPRQTKAKTAETAIESILIDYSRLMETHRDITCIWLDWSTAMRAQTWPLYLQYHAKVRGIFEAILQRGKINGEISADVDVGDAAWVLISTGHMISHMKFAGISNARINRAASSVVRSYFRHVSQGNDKGDQGTVTGAQSSPGT